MDLATENSVSHCFGNHRRRPLLSPTSACRRLLLAAGIDFLVNVVASYASSRVINSKIKKTAAAKPDDFLYYNREYYERDYDVDGSSMQTENYRIDADASGTDSRKSLSELEQREVLYLVDRNANLNGFEVTYAVLHQQSDGSWAPLYFWDHRKPNERYLETYTDYYGGYVQPLTDEEIQEDLDRRRRNWNRYSYGTRYRRPITVRALKKGHVVGRTDKRFVCDKEVRLWSDFEFNRVPGDTSAGPNELQQPGQRPNYVTSFSYYAREAGYNGSIVTKVPYNEKPFVEYPEPESYKDHNYMEHKLESIKWDNYKIIGSPNWTGEATRFFKHKKIRNWCTFCNRKHTFVERWFQRGWLCRNTQWRTRHEIPVYQNESVTKP